jgi:hypothetical protein
MLDHVSPSQAPREPWRQLPTDNGTLSKGAPIAALGRCGFRRPRQGRRSISDARPHRRSAANAFLAINNDLVTDGRGGAKARHCVVTFGNQATLRISTLLRASVAGRDRGVDRRGCAEVGSGRRCRCRSVASRARSRHLGHICGDRRGGGLPVARWTDSTAIRTALILALQVDGDRRSIYGDSPSPPRRIRVRLGGEASPLGHDQPVDRAVNDEASCRQDLGCHLGRGRRIGRCRARYWPER